MADVRSPPNPKWFGACISYITNRSPTISLPFDKEHQKFLSPHFEKAHQRRKAATTKIRQLDPQVYDVMMKQFGFIKTPQCLIGGKSMTEMLRSYEMNHEDESINDANESIKNEDELMKWEIKNRTLAEGGSFAFDTLKYPLLESLLTACFFDTNTDLSDIHTQENGKETLFKHLTLPENPKLHVFQSCFEKFVLEKCAPQLSAVFSCDEIFYQHFPCIRIIRPNEFSIGPHADIRSVLKFFKVDD